MRGVISLRIPVSRSQKSCVEQPTTMATETTVSTTAIRGLGRFIGVLPFAADYS
jgi:hypothetical protein